MFKALLIATVTMIAFSGFAQAPKVKAQGNHQGVSDITIIFSIQGQSDPNDIFFLQVAIGVVGSDMMLGSAPPGRAFCGNKERQLKLYPSYEYTGPCENGGRYTLKASSGGDFPARSYGILRDYIDESNSKSLEPVASGSPVVSGGFYVVTYRYPTEGATPAPPAEPPMPDGAPNVGGGGMSQHRTPLVQPAPVAAGRSSIAYRR